MLYAAMIDLSRVTNYYVACGYTDLRLGIDGLAAIVMTQYGVELQEERSAHGSDQSPVLGRRRLRAAVQASEQRLFPMAAK